MFELVMPWVYFRHISGIDQKEFMNNTPFPQLLLQRQLEKAIPYGLGHWRGAVAPREGVFAGLSHLSNRVEQEARHCLRRSLAMESFAIDCNPIAGFGAVTAPGLLDKKYNSPFGVGRGNAASPLLPLAPNIFQCLCSARF